MFGWDHEGQRRRRLLRRDGRDQRSVHLDHRFGPDGSLEGGHHHSLLEVLVGQVGAGERSRLDIELMGPPPQVGGRGGVVLRPPQQVLDAGLQHRVVGVDALGEGGHVAVEGGLDEGVLVAGVVHQHRHHLLHLVGQRPPLGLARGVEVTGRLGEGEQLGPDALVDVPVEVVHDRLQRGGRGGQRAPGLEVGDGHDGCLLGGGARTFRASCPVGLIVNESVSARA